MTYIDKLSDAPAPEPHPDPEAWTYQPSSQLDQSLVERLKHFPREPEIVMYALRLFCNAVMRLWLRCYHRLSIHGREHLPAHGPFIVIANHTSHLDAMCLLSMLPVRAIHHTFPAAASDYFFVSLPRLALAAVVINALPFHRQAGIHQSLNLCRHLLEAPGSRNILILFPEGTRQSGGQIGTFKPGIALLASRCGVPVVPCYLENTGKAWPRGKWFPRPRRVRLHIGPPRIYARETGAPRTHQDLQAITDDLRQAVLTQRDATTQRA
jgi:1-acyl-sn-glycerol-3-phosphate acyltransferase